MEHQRCANMPAQGNALGKLSNNEPALKGRDKGCAALSGLEDFFAVLPRAFTSPPAISHLSPPPPRWAGLFPGLCPGNTETAKVPDRV